MVQHLNTPFNCLTLPQSQVFAGHSWTGASNGVVNWLFAPGMLYGSLTKWWDKDGERKQPHEGVDFYYFVTGTGEKFPVGPNTTVPLLYDGEIVRCVDDFLGSSLFARHVQYRQGNLVLYTIYGHTVPEPGMKIGSKVSAGKVIARVAAGRKNRARVPPHLHLSIAFVSESCEPSDLDWRRLIQPDVVLCNPLQLLILDYRIHENIFCE